MKLFSTLFMDNKMLTMCLIKGDISVMLLSLNRDNNGAGVQF